MGDEVNPAVWGFVGTLVGAAASIGTAWIASTHTSRIESQKAKDSRTEIFRAFQRQTLLELQESLNFLTSHVTDVFRVEHMLSQTGEGNWEEARLKEEKFAILNQVRHAMKIATWVADVEIRHAAANYLNVLTDFMYEENSEAAEDLRSKLTDQFADLITSSGACLRSHYEQT